LKRWNAVALYGFKERDGDEEEDRANRRHKLGHGDLTAHQSEAT
jgi:hypothetical protein